MVSIFNREAENITGISTGEVIGKEFHVLPEEIEKVIQISITHKEDIRNSEIEIVNRKSKKIIFVNLNTSAFYDKQGKFLGIQVIFSDVTQVKNLREEIKRAEKLASLGVMAAGIAHEIKNPLVSIKTFAQLLPQKFQDEEFRNTFAVLTVKEVDRINSLVEQILLFAGPRASVFKKMDLVEVLKSTLLLFSAQMENKEIEIGENYYSPQIIIEADDEKLKQAFLNIFMNSRDAIDKQGVIQVDVTDCGEKINIFIKDSGSGVKREIMGKIFDPFFTTKSKGTGLGLSIVASIINEHNGKININTTDEKETTTFIELPKKQKEKNK